MKKLLFFLLLYSILLQASTTNITATITGADSVVWANGSYIISFIPTPGKPLGQFNVNGATFPQGPFTGAINGSGTFTITLTDNSTITPSGSMWAFTICPNATFQCFTSNIGIAGASQNLSSTLSAAATSINIFALPIPKAYTDAEVQAPPGVASTYYNVTSNKLRIWDGSVWSSVGSTGNLNVQYGMLSSQYNGEANGTHTIPGLTANVIAGRFYTWHAILYEVRDSTCQEEYLVSGTATTVSSLESVGTLTVLTNDGFINAIKQVPFEWHDGASNPNSTESASIYTFDGSIHPNGSGTLEIRFGCIGATGATPSYIRQGSFQQVIDVTP